MKRIFKSLSFIALILAMLSSLAQAQESLIHSFSEGPSGTQVPFGALTPDGSVLYGVTLFGGSSDQGALYKINTDGTGFTFLHEFSGPDGQNPYEAPVLSGTTLYGNTQSGGAYGGGVIYRIETDGTGFALVKEFNPGVVREPVMSFGQLLLDGSTLYGTSSWSG